jgi:hypothetical protein
MRCYLSFLLLVQLSAAMAQPEKANVARAGQATPGRDSCGDNRSIPSLVKHLAGTVIFKQSLAALAEQVKREPGREFTVAFGQDSLGEVVASGLEGGNKRSGVITALPFPVADMHNHPRNTPPSSGDLYGLISQNRKKGTYAVRFVLTSGNLMYALVITDSLAAHTFTKNYPPQQMPGYSPLFPDTVLQEYRDMLYLYGTAEEAAMAFLLETYSTGVLLLKRYGNGPFLRLRTIVSGRGEQRKFTAITCP